MNNKVGDSSKSFRLNKFKNFSTKGKNKKLIGMGPDYKLNLSEQSKELKKDLNKAQSLTQSKPTFSIPSIPTPSLPSVPDISDVEVVVEKANETKDIVDMVEKVSKKKEKVSHKPAVFFIGGMDLFGTVGEFIFEDGIKLMAESIDKAKYFGWDQKDEMLEQINKRSKDQKVILVGHGLGGDTAVEVAQELNTVENRFRSIDLLVTLNSKGFDNDFIPQNVVKNLNFITSDNGFTDDGPNIALNYNRTEVKNFLRNESHNSLDDSTDVQIEIMDAINKLI